MTNLVLRCAIDWNVLLRSFSEIDLERGKRIFQLMPKWDLVSWNTLLKIHVQSGDATGAEEIFDQMPARDIISWNTSLALDPRNFHLMPMRDVVTANAVLRSHKAAHQVFLDNHQMMITRNLLTWSIAIAAAAADQEQQSVAIQIFNRMPAWDSISWNTALSAALSAAVDDPAAMDRIQQHFFFFSPPLRDSASWNSIVNGFASSGNIHLAEEILRAMPQRSVISSNALITAYARMEASSHAREMFLQMTHRDLVSWNALITAASSASDAKIAFEKSPMWTIESWNSLIAAQAQRGSDSEAIQIFCLLLLEGVRPQERAFSLLLNSCASLTAFSRGRIIHNCIKESGLELDSPVLVSTLISMYGSCGRLDEAKRIFQERASCSSVICRNAMLSAFGRIGEYMQARLLFQEMLLQGIKPNKSTFTILLTICSHGGHWGEGLMIFRWMMVGDFDLAPVAEHFACVVDLLGRQGLVQEAEDLLRSMPFEPGDVPWLALLGACTSQSDDQRGLRAAAEAHLIDSSSAEAIAIFSCLSRRSQEP